MSFTEFRDTVDSLPRATTRFNRARRIVVETLDKLTSEIRGAYVVLDDTERAIDHALEGPAPRSSG